jgi:hypothetical protein
MSIHADDEFSLRFALESELDDVLPSADLAVLVIQRHRKTRRRRVAGAVSLVVVCAGIGVPLGLSGPSSKPPQHDPGQRVDQQTGSVMQVQHARSLIIDRPVVTAAAA